MPALLIKHRVADFDKWRQAYEQHGGARDAASITSSIVCRDEADANNVTVYMEVESLERAREFLASEDLAQTMQDAGVLERPQVQFLGSVQHYPH